MSISSTWNLQGKKALITGGTKGIGHLPYAEGTAAFNHIVSDFLNSY